MDILKGKYDWEEIQNCLDNENLSFSEIFKKYNISRYFFKKARENSFIVVDSKRKYRAIVDKRNKKNNSSIEDKISQYNWELIQTEYNEGNSINDIMKKYKFTKYFLKEVRKEGLFKIDIKKRYNDKYKNRHHSEEVKRKISEKRKSYLKQNPEKHPWKRHHKFISTPCENLKQKLKENNIYFLEEECPVQGRYFSADILLPDLATILEINGSQHYDRVRGLKPYYQNRHDLIKKSGWHIIEIYYKLAYNVEFCNMIINDIKNESIIRYKEYIFSYTKIDKEYILDDNYNFESKKITVKLKSSMSKPKLKKNESINSKCICNLCNINLKEKRANMCVQCKIMKSRKVIRPSHNQLIEDMKTMSMVQIGKKYGVSDNAVRKWIKNYEKI